MKKILLFIFIVFTVNGHAQKVSTIRGEEFVSENGDIKKMVVLQPLKVILITSFIPVFLWMKKVR
jgi:hypothetical protein